MTPNSQFRGVSLAPVLLGGLLAAGWLLPNHYAPWRAFHTDAWTAAALLAIAFWRSAVDRAPLRVGAAGLALLGLALVPLVQHAIGLLPLRSDAFLSAIYLFGAAAAFILGEHWARSQRDGPATLVLLAAAAASVVSVGLQIYQWRGLAASPTWQEFWIYPSGVSRPYANLGQPNQLASLLLWGVLGVAWAWHKGWLRARTACAAAAFILFGVALSESRTAALSLTTAILFLSLRRPACVPKQARRVAQALFLFYLACLLGIEPLSRLVGQHSELSVFERSAGELRFAIWRMALDAIVHRPWLGYGWNHVHEAYLAVLPAHPALADLLVGQSHNLVLDLALWVGIPLAALVTAAALWWLWRLVRLPTDLGQLLALAALAVMLVHAMLEFPLHYGYFLWPFALLAGALSARIGLPVLALPRPAAIAAPAALSLVLATAVHDYFSIETAFTELRFELQHIGQGHDQRPPRVLLLTDWRDFIVMSRAVPAAGMDPQALQHWQDLLIYNTSPLPFRKLVGALALNGRTEEARYWSVRSCAVLAPAQCQALQREVPPSGARPAL
jgi:O-antigen ligase